MTKSQAKRVISRVLFSLMLTITASAINGAPFTIDNVLSKLSGNFDKVSRVKDQLPGNVSAFEDQIYSQNLHLDIYQPKGTGLFPAVLIVHGGGWETGHRYMERPFAKQLAGFGFVTVPVSYRLGKAGQFPAALHDLKSAVRWLRANAQRWQIDPNRIAVVGGSAGGHLAALLGASNGVADFEGQGVHQEQVSTVQAVVNIDGAASFPDARLIAQEKQKPNATSRFLQGNYSEQRTAWFAASPLYYVGPNSAPTLFINSTAPTPILPGREAMSARLQALGIHSTIVVIPNTPHPFWLVHPWFTKTLSETVRFLQQHL
ncbi:MAG: alpha/beta hydrolase [Spongiibacteraceae bacterium]|nr:alpha/beta hydrolase [Spongiibacteraceae bacterium]